MTYAAPTLTACSSGHVARDTRARAACSLAHIGEAYHTCGPGSLPLRSYRETSNNGMQREPANISIPGGGCRAWHRGGGEPFASLLPLEVETWLA